MFEVDPGHPSHNLHPTPLTALGRFAHEAVGVDPRAGRPLPDRGRRRTHRAPVPLPARRPHRSYGALRNGGQLEAMRCTDGARTCPTCRCSRRRAPRCTSSGSPCPTRRPPRCRSASSSPPTEVTRSRKFEGVWWGDVDVDRSSTCRDARPTSCARSPGSATARWPSTTARCGATTRTAARSRSRCTCRVNPDPASDHPDGPDNITVSPYGGFFLAEDGEGAQHLLAVDEHGKVAPFARNRESGRVHGRVLLPRRPTLFANLQDQGLCFAITGPFHKLR